MGGRGICVKYVAILIALIIVIISVVGGIYRNKFTSRVELIIRTVIILLSILGTILVYLDIR